MQKLSFSRQSILPVGMVALLAMLLIFLPDLLLPLLTQDPTQHALWQNLANLGLVLASMEQALPSSEERWGLALESSEIGVWDWNTLTNEMFYSQVYWKILGFEPDEANASVEDFDARVHPEDKPAVLDNTVQLLRGDVPAFSREYRLRCKDGSYKWVLSRGKVVSRSADGQAVRVVGTITDISARKAAEVDLQLAAQVYANSGEAILVTDHANRILSVNRAFTEITGYAP